MSTPTSPTNPKLNPTKLSWESEYRFVDGTSIADGLFKAFRLYVDDAPFLDLPNRLNQTGAYEIDFAQLDLPDNQTFKLTLTQVIEDANGERESDPAGPVYVREQDARKPSVPFGFAAL